MELRAEDLTVRFGGLAAVDDVTLSLRAGEILGLIGPNGAGKTTLVNVLSGFQKPSAGRVRIGNRECGGLKRHEFGRNGVARTFQAVRLFRGLTLRENVEVAFAMTGLRRSAARRSAYALLDWIGLGARAELPASALSHGEERKAGIARALALAPRFLLLDEPAAGLNAAEVGELRTLLGDIRRQFDCAVLLIEHNMALVTGLCERIHVLDGGRTIAIGTPDAIRADPAVRRAYRCARGPAPLCMTRDLSGMGRSGEPLLRVCNLDVRYGRIAALRGASIEVRGGEIVAVVGANGAGKTTLLSSIAGLVRPVAGDILWCDQSIVGVSLETMAKRGLALVPEGRQIFATLTVEENLRLGAIARSDVRQVADDIAASCRAFPILQARRSQPAGQLSGGEQQQLAIARALLVNPKLLMLDEPSLGLAPAIVEQVFEIIARIRDDGVTVLIVEQNAPRAMDMADRTYVLSHGTVSMSGSKAELLGHPAFDAAYFGLGTE